jgi:preprotein translocase subunit SecA
MFGRIINAFKNPTQKKGPIPYQELIEQINELESEYTRLNDDTLFFKTGEFRLRISNGEKLDDLLPNAFATLRETCRRTVGIFPNEVQILGGLVLHQGKIAEIQPEEGKEISAAFAIYLNSLTNTRIHLFTSDDQRAEGFAYKLAPLLIPLGGKIGLLRPGKDVKRDYLVSLSSQVSLLPEERRIVYQADVVISNWNEFGFDYLRDNMAMSLSDQVQGGHHFAIIDNVDNVLIDEARTPLIISGTTSGNLEWYVRMAQVVKQLKASDYEINVKDRQVALTSIGLAHVEQILGALLIDLDHPEDVRPEQARLRGYLEQAMRAEYLYKRDRDYIVQAGQVVIVNEHTGRLMPGSRWGDGLHQAVEAKEAVQVEPENITYATITVQNYFRMYEKLSGMTEGGGIVADAKFKIVPEEFKDVYGLQIVAIPGILEYRTSSVNSDLVAIKAKDEEGYSYTYFAKRDNPQRAPLFFLRKDYPDVIYKTTEAKLRAIVKEIIHEHVRGRPVLVGTTSFESSEMLSHRLQAEMVRRVIQIALVRHVWMEANNRWEDGRLIPELQMFNDSLEKISPDVLRKFIQPYGLINLNLEDPSNLTLVLDILRLDERDEERLKKVLQAGVGHRVLNSRRQAEELQILAEAGKLGSVTIATKKVIRGTNIKLGGELDQEIVMAVNRVLRKAGVLKYLDMTHEEHREALKHIDPSHYVRYDKEVKLFLQYFDDMERVKELGGLHVIGAERDEARRIDNQLRSCASQLGEPGSSRFYLSLQDELMLLQGGLQVSHLMEQLHVDDTLPLEVRLVSNLIEQSQYRMEGANFDVRKHLLKYDDVLNLYRAEIYAQRNLILAKQDLSEDIANMLKQEIKQRVEVGWADEEGPWQFIAWLEQIQPPFMNAGRIFPSFCLSLLLKELNRSTDVRCSALGLATRAIEAENIHHLHAIEGLIINAEVGLENQVVSLSDAMDTFFDSLDNKDWTDRPHAQKSLEEINGLAGFELQLNYDQLNRLDNDPASVRDEIKNLIAGHLTRMYASRVINAVQNRLGESIGERFYISDWDDAADKIINAARLVLEQRWKRLVGNNGQLTHEIENLMPFMGNDTSKLQLLLSLPQGKRSVFDQKTHRQVHQAFSRFNYVFLVAQLLNSNSPEQLVDEVLTHLEEAQESLQMVWGESEFIRLSKTVTFVGDLGDWTSEIPVHLQDTSPDSLTQEERMSIVEVLGRITLNNKHRQLLTTSITNQWVSFLGRLEELKHIADLEKYANRDPLSKYKLEAAKLFQTLLDEIRYYSISRLFSVPPSTVEQSNSSQPPKSQTGEIPSSDEAADQSVEKDCRQLIQDGDICVRSDDWLGAIRLYRKAIYLARIENDTDLEAYAQTRLDQARQHLSPDKEE